MIALSKSIAVQFGKHSIRSNVILPGPTRSPLQARWDDDPQAAQNLGELIPLGRVGATQDMANACLFLLSDAAGYITGTELIVDGRLDGVTVIGGSWPQLVQRDFRRAVQPYCQNRTTGPHRGVTLQLVVAPRPGGKPPRSPRFDDYRNTARQTQLAAVGCGRRA